MSDELLNSIIKETENNMHNNIHNDICLTDKQVSLLDSIGVDYKSFNNMSSLIFYLENSMMEDEELDMLIDELMESNYYHNTNK